jgi:NTE family protein
LRDQRADRQSQVFKAEEINVDHVLASTCLPLLMRPVEIDGEVYWDGEFSANL